MQSELSNFFTEYAVINASNPMWSSYDNQSWTVTPTLTSNFTNSDWAINVHQTTITVLSSLIACVGLIGNALNFFVLQAYHTPLITCGGECTARVNLLGLACADFFVCLTTLPLGYAKREYETRSFMFFYTLAGPGLATYFLTVSVWMVLLMSIVRYWAVCRPLTSRTWLTQHHMVRGIVLLYVAALIFHIPSLLRYTYEIDYHSSNETLRSVNNSHVKIPHPNTITYVVYEREVWHNQTVNLIYHAIEIFLTNIGPFVGVVLSNLAVIRACKRSDACRQSFTEPTQQQKKNGASSSVATDPGVAPAHPVYKRTMSATRDHIYTTPGVFVFTPSTPFRLSLQRSANRATNRVTPLLLTVIFAFLLFIAPFGIVHLVCLQIMRDVGTRVRYEPDARRLYAALNLTVQWTNVVQLLGCALNFFLYFLVSTTFRRTTKRTFRKFYKRIKLCHQELKQSFRFRSSTPEDCWDDDIRTNELRRELNLKLTPICVADPRLPPNRMDTNLRGRISNLFRLRHASPTPPSTRSAGESHAHSCPLPGSRWNSDQLDNMVINHSCGQLKCDCEVCCNAGPLIRQFNTRCPHCAQLFTLDLSLPETRSQASAFPSTSIQRCLQTRNKELRHSQSGGCVKHDVVKDIPKRINQTDQDPNSASNNFTRSCEYHFPHHCHRAQYDHCPSAAQFSARETIT